MTTFDAPSREACQVRRERTNTPLQALLLLNEPQFIEAARALAERTLREAGARPTDDSLDLHVPAGRWPEPPGRRETWPSSSRDPQGLPAHYASEPDAAKELIETGETKPDPPAADDPVRVWPPGHDRAT